MPDPDLPEHLKARLDRELAGGAPLASPLPAQARYTLAAAGRPAAVPRWRLVSAAGAAAALIAVAVLAGPPQARAWVGQSVGNIARGFESVTGPSSPSPQRSPEHEPSAVPSARQESPDPARSPEPSESPEANESPEPSESPEPPQSPEGNESPEPTQSPDGHDSPRASPSPTPEPSDGGGDHSGEGG